MRILLVSQMYPGPDDPDLGAFVQGIERALAERGHEIERVVTEGRGGGKRRHLRLAREVRRAARRFEPDVVYAHFLVPTGLSAALFGGAPLVATAHGRDVRNIGAYPGIAAATRFVARRAASLIAVSDYLRRELEAKIPEARGKTEVVDCGVDLSLFETRPVPGTGQGRNGPVYVCVGSLIERKNVVRLADAFAQLGTGRLVFVGDGPLRPSSRGEPTSRSPDASRTTRCRATSRESTVLCQPSPDRAVRPGAPRGDGLRALGRRDARRRARPSSCRPRPASSSTRSTPPRSRTRCAAPPSSRARTPPRAPPRPAHDVRRQAEKVESILERAARGRQA